MAACNNCGGQHWECVCAPIEVEEKECTFCDGLGYFNESDCCGGALLGMSDDDYICGDCHDHCERAFCEECKGTGKAIKQNEYYIEVKNPVGSRA